MPHLLFQTGLPVKTEFRLIVSQCYLDWYGDWRLHAPSTQNA